MSVLNFTKPAIPHELKTLSNSDPYKLVTALEFYVEDQSTTGSYDFVANKSLLKLYQCYPDLVSTEIIAKLLCLSLMRLPSTDYLVLSYLVSGQALTKDSSLVAVHSAADLLESGKYKPFWSLRSENKSLFSSLNFDGYIRRFIIKNICSTFKNISVKSLCEMLGITENSLKEVQAESPRKFQVASSVDFFLFLVL